MESEIASVITRAAAGLAPAEYCLATVQHWSTCMTKNEWAAWTQAVFSVLAVCGAIIIGRRQIRIEAERDSQVATTTTAIRKSIEFQCSVAIKKLKTIASRWRQGIDDARKIPNINADIDKVRLLVLPTEEQCFRIAPTNKYACNTLLQALQLHRTLVINLPPTPIGPTSTMAGGVAHAINQFDILRENLEFALQQLGEGKAGVEAFDAAIDAS